MTGHAPGGAEPSPSRPSPSRPSPSRPSRASRLSRASSASADLYPDPTSSATTSSATTSSATTTDRNNGTRPAGEPGPSLGPSLGRATAVMAAGTLLSRLTGLGRNIALTLFGLGALSDAYLLANNSPNIIFELVLGGVLAATLVPVFVDLVRRGDDRSRQGIDAIVTLSLVVAAGLATLLTIGAPWMIRLYTIGRESSGPDDERTIEVATTLLRLFGPQVAVYGFITVATALLNARRRFAAPMLAPVLNNVVVIAVLLVARWHINRLRTDDSAAGLDGTTIDAVSRHRSAQLLLGIGTTAGVVAMGVVLLLSLRRAGLGLRWRWDPGHPAVRTVLRLSGWTVGYVIANQLALFFVAATAYRGAKGDYSAYNIAYSTFFVLPHGIFAVSIMTALQPQLSQDFLERRRGRFRRHLRDGITRVLSIMVPAAVGYVVLARPIVSLVLRHEGMSDASADLTADTLAVMAIGLPGFSVYLLLMNACKAVRDTRVTFTINAIENAINIALAAVLYRRYGVPGLAFAFAAAYLIAAVIAGIAVARRTAGLGAAAIGDRCLRIGGASAVMGGGAWAASRAVRALVDTVLGDDPAGLARNIGLAAQVGAGVVAGVTVYLVASRLAGVGEVTAIVTGIARRIRRAPGPVLPTVIPGPLSPVPSSPLPRPTDPRPTDPRPTDPRGTA